MVKINKSLEKVDDKETSSRIDKMKKLSEDDERSEDILLLDPDSYSEVSTRKRREIIQELRNNSYSSKKDLAESLNRDIKNIYEDLEILRRHNVVKFEKNGKSLSPVLKHEYVSGETI